MWLSLLLEGRSDTCTGNWAMARQAGATMAMPGQAPNTTGAWKGCESILTSGVELHRHTQPERPLPCRFRVCPPPYWFARNIFTSPPLEAATPTFMRCHATCLYMYLEDIKIMRCSKQGRSPSGGQFEGLFFFPVATQPSRLLRAASRKPTIWTTGGWCKS